MGQLIPDYSYPSKYDDKSKFNKIVFANKVPSTSSEFGEIQDIQNNERRSVLREIISNGCINIPQILFESDILKFQENQNIFYNGDVFIVPKSAQFNPSVANNSSVYVYVEVFEKTITSTDTLREYGCENAGAIGNYIIDDFVGEATSKRVQLCTRFVTTAIESTLENYIPICRIAKSITGVVTMTDLRKEVTLKIRVDGGSF